MGTRKVVTSVVSIAVVALVGLSIFKALTDDPRWQTVKPRVAAVITGPAREAFEPVASQAGRPTTTP